MPLSSESDNSYDSVDFTKQIVALLVDSIEKNGGAEYLRKVGKECTNVREKSHQSVQTM